MDIKGSITKESLRAILFSIIILSAPTWAKDWGLLAVPGLTPIYIDRDSIKRNGDVVDVQVLLAGTLNYEISRRLWCKDSKSSRNLLEDSVITVYPGSDDAVILAAACKR
jgi:hypothetical protein